MAKELVNLVCAWSIRVIISEVYFKVIKVLGNV